MKFKIITGFREDQYYSIDAEELHKAYYLFRNPEERGVFNNGVALVGRNIQGIEPDYHGTMGWKSTHKLDGDDMGEIRRKGVDREMREVLREADEVAQLMQPQHVRLPLSEAKEQIKLLE